jgi:hypothetical protein
MTSARGGAAILTAAVIGAIGCSSNPLPPDGARFPFIAVAGDFDGFRSWPSHAIESPAASGSTHVSGARTVYINELPPAGAAAFPVGTRIVKETAADGKLFARVKRGGGYNTTGAVDWEWFELQETSSGAVFIFWRGVGPPAGEIYGGDPNAGCNTCHRTVPANDYVLSPGLMLAPATDGAAGDTGGGDAGGGENDGGVATGDAGDGGDQDAIGAPDGSAVD